MKPADPHLQALARAVLRLMTLMAVVLGVLLALPGCTATAPKGIAEMRAGCPPLTPPPRRNDNDAQTRRVAEVEGWYKMCRDTVLRLADKWESLP